MSVQAISWVLENSPTKNGSRLVLLSIANHANDHGEAWPSMATMAREANLDEKTVKRLISGLVKEGHLGRKVNGAPDARIPGDRRPNLYRLVGFDGGHRSSPPLQNGGHESSRPGSQDEAPAGGTDSTPKPSGSTVKEPENPPAKAEDPILVASREIVKDWWDATTPKPAQKFVAVVKIVERMLRAGWPPQAVRWALGRAPTPSVGTLEFALRSSRRGSLEQVRSAAAEYLARRETA